MDEVQATIKEMEIKLCDVIVDLSSALVQQEKEMRKQMREEVEKEKKQLQKEIRQYIPNGHDHSNHVRRITTEKRKEKGNHLS